MIFCLSQKGEGGGWQALINYAIQSPVHNLPDTDVYVMSRREDSEINGLRVHIISP